MYVPYNVLMGRLNVMAWLYFMEKANRCSETDLADYDVVCPVLKIHYQLDQWSDFFSEHNNDNIVNFIFAIIFWRPSKI